MDGQTQNVGNGSVGWALTCLFLSCGRAGWLAVMALGKFLVHTMEGSDEKSCLGLALLARPDRTRPERPGV